MTSSETEVSNQIVKDSSKLTVTKRNGKYYGSVEVNRKLLGNVIGVKGCIIKAIQASTKTHITIPKVGNTLVIDGKSEYSVIMAHEEIVSRLNTNYRYFLSIPIKNETVLEKVLSFKEKVLQKSTDKSRITEKAFRKTNKLHLTISTLKLTDEKAIKNCVEKIDKFRMENANLFKPMKINFKGVGFWGDDHTSARCVFTKPVENDDFNNLSNFAMKMEEYLMKEKLISETQKERMDFHLILINNKFLRFDIPYIKNFDITEFIDDVIDWDFESFDVGELHLSQKLTGNDVNYYKNEGTWLFNENNITE